MRIRYLPLICFLILISLVFGYVFFSLVLWVWRLCSLRFSSSMQHQKLCPISWIPVRLMVFLRGSSSHFNLSPFHVFFGWGLQIQSFASRLSFLAFGNSYFNAPVVSPETFKESIFDHWVVQGSGYSPSVKHYHCAAFGIPGCCVLLDLSTGDGLSWSRQYRIYPDNSWNYLYSPCLVDWFVYTIMAMKQSIIVLIPWCIQIVFSMVLPSPILMNWKPSVR